MASTRRHRQSARPTTPTVLPDSTAPINYSNYTVPFVANAYTSIYSSNWRTHLQAPASSYQECRRHVSNQSRFLFRVGETGLPSDTSYSSQRAEFEGTNVYMPRRTDYWWSFAYRMTGNPPDSGWCSIVQVHQRPDPGEFEGSPPFGMFWVRNGSLQIHRRFDPNSTTTSESVTNIPVTITANMTTSLWHKVVLKLNFDYGDGTGALSCWYDSQSTVQLSNVAMGFNDVRDVYPKFGIYRGTCTGINELEFANMEFGTASLLSRVASPLPIQ